MKVPSSKFQVPSSSNGQTILIAAVFFLFISLAIIAGFAFPSFKESTISREALLSKKSYFLAEAGIEDISYRIKTGKQYDANETLTLDGFSATVSTANLSADEKEISSSANVNNLIRKAKTKLTTASGVDFHYGVQVGDGGLVMENNSSVTGNVFSNGPVSGANSNSVKGDVISAGLNGAVDGIHSTSSVYSHNISNSTIDKNAYYINIINTFVGGALYPDSSDQATTTLAISDNIIEEWEIAAAVSTTTSPCPYRIESDVTLGPVRITCDVEIQGNPTVLLAGPVWINGNLTIQNTAVVRIDPLLGRKSVAIIADNPSNRLTSSKIRLKNSVQFQNSGTAGSYILVISQNKSSETGGGEKAIEVENSASGEFLVYAGHGEILLQNSVNLKEVSGYKIRLQNTANVIYSTGLANLLFEIGPGGSWNFDNWRETE